MRVCDVAVRASKFLEWRKVYTAPEIAEFFGTAAGAFRSTVQRAPDYDSVFLLVTASVPGRSGRRNALDGDELFFVGENRGTSNPWLIEHEKRGLEILVFYRESQDEHLGAYRYEGRFAYVDHHGVRPAIFHFRRIAGGELEP